MWARGVFLAYKFLAHKIAEIRSGLIKLKGFNLIRKGRGLLPELSSHKIGSKSPILWDIVAGH